MYSKMTVSNLFFNPISPDPSPDKYPMYNIKAIGFFSDLTGPAGGQELLGPGKFLILALKFSLSVQKSP